jgi:hypothetical protein
VAVIGGGNSGVEAAIDLAGIVGHVTLLEFEATLRADAVLQKKLFSLGNVEVITAALSTASESATARRSTACCTPTAPAAKSGASTSPVSLCRSVCCRTASGSRGHLSCLRTRRDRDRCPLRHFTAGRFRRRRRDHRPLQADRRRHGRGHQSCAYRLRSPHPQRALLNSTGSEVGARLAPPAVSDAAGR